MTCHEGCTVTVRRGAVSDHNNNPEIAHRLTCKGKTPVARKLNVHTYTSFHVRKNCGQLTINFACACRGKHFACIAYCSHNAWSPRRCVCSCLPACLSVCLVGQSVYLSVCELSGEQHKYAHSVPGCKRSTRKKNQEQERKPIMKPVNHKCLEKHKGLSRRPLF